jgi:6-hydroxycyclohex-1-ene-1-carbonyl-CoA dehydrogenase
MRIEAWTFHEPRAPMVLTEREAAPAAGEVIVRVAGCGVCHTDLGFYYDGVPTRHALPLALGHEISGRVQEAGPGAERWIGRNVIVPAVMPCGTCPACAAGRGSVCPHQVFPGNDVDGGFGSHVCVPAAGLCPVPDLDAPGTNPERLDLASLAVIADAVTTPFQALARAGLGPGDLAVFVGVGGVGGFGAQIAAARGAAVVALDVDEGRLALAAQHGADLCLRADAEDFSALRKKVRAFADGRGIPSFRRKLFETSGTPQGQTTAFGLLEPGAYLSIVGYTPEKVSVRLSNVMAFDATVQGNWGCLPENYPAALALVLSGKVRLRPFVTQRPLRSINATFADLHAHRVRQRVVLVP